MAEPFNRLTASRYAEQVRRKYGEDALLETIAPELQLSDQLDDHSEPEDAYIAGRMLWWGRESTGALAANFSGCGIRNVLPNALVVVTDAIIEAQPAADLYVLVSRASSAVGVQSLSTPFTTLDSRWGAGSPLNAGVTSIKFQNAAGVGVFGWEITTVAAVDRELHDLGIVIGPGADLIIRRATVNLVCTVSWRGYIVPIKPEAL